MSSSFPQISGYTVTEPLYLGDRTAVYRAVETASQRSVVIKVLRREYPSFSELVQFRNQYTVAKNLDFPGIVQPLSLEPLESGYALVMEDGGGVALGDYLQQASLELTDILEIAIQLADTLHHLCQQRVIHKDIKPANILIHPESKQIELIDFSIASLLPKETQAIQSPNRLEGTLAYLAPEQTGRMNRAIDYRTDFYALGVTLYQLLTGRLPFTSDDPLEVIHCHLAQSAVAVNAVNPEIPTMVAAIVSKLMEKNAEDRYQSALGLKHDLQQCLMQWTETGAIAEFELGQRDLSDRFTIPDKLYGREAEVKTLLQAFERVSQGATEMMLVAGFSGIGKTAVVNEVHKPIVKNRGYFVKGKYDQFNRSIPFSAFVAAFRDLMGQLLGESDADLARWKEKILAVVGENGQVLIEVIPELEQIIGKQPPVPELSGTAAQNRFNLLFQNFIAVFTTQEHPLVMFLDDLQWADSASLKLIKVLIGEGQSGYLLLLGAYRDNEVFPAHPLMLCLADLEKYRAIISTITLASLSINCINQLVAETLSCTTELATPLTKSIYQKTRGNPFFTTQFLKGLYEDGLIVFNPNLGYWECDLVKVREAALTDNVVEFMSERLHKLPEAAQTVLKLAACIGNQFDLETLAIVCNIPSEKVATDLWSVLREGLILPQSEAYKFFQDWKQEEGRANGIAVGYRFLHDRVQQAAYALIPDAQKQKTHYCIGKLLLQKISPEDREERIFELVNQLNYGVSLINEQNERDTLSRLNAIACRKAKSATAYQASREYAQVGLSLLGKQAWSKQYPMTLEFHEISAEVALLCGDFEEMERLFEIVCDRAQSLVDRIKVYCFKIQSFFAQNKLSEAVAVALNILRQLGVEFPTSPTQSDIEAALSEIYRLMSDRDVEDLIHLPRAIDKEKIAIVQIANRIAPAAYFIGSPLNPLLVALAVKESILFGNTPDSAYSYAAYAFMACNPLQDVETGVKFGQLALQMVSQPEFKSAKPEVSATVGALCFSRKAHAKDSLPLLQEGYATGLEIGNPEIAGHSAHNFCLNAFWSGRPLLSLERETHAYYNGLLQFKQSTTANYCRIYWQAVLNLLGHSQDPTVLTGEAFQETECLPQLLEASDLYGIYIYSVYKLMLCYLFGELESAQKHALEVEQYFTAGVGTLGEPAFYFYDALVILASLDSDVAPTPEAFEKIEKNQHQLQQQWAKYAPMNHQHKVDLIEAEKCRVLGDKIKASERYDRAIAGAKAHDYIQEEALANELAAKFYLSWNRPRIAQDYAIEAYYCYARWEAKAKVADLEQRYRQLLAPILAPKVSDITNPSHNTLFALGSVTSTHAPTSNSSTSIALDLATILKAYQAISSEIELEKLLSSLLSIIIENAGAEKCVLMLMRDDRLLVKGSMTLDTEPVVLQRLPVEQSQKIPLKLIYKVKHNLKTEVLVDASVEPSLARDPYIQQNQPKSVLCSPVCSQGKLMGILYLENNLTPGAFTRDRVELLNLICTQAAISLENARLYERSKNYAQQLEQVLTDLKDAQLQLVQSEKMSVLGNLVAGVAHEINNPVSFISGNVNEAIASVEDITEFISLYQEKFPNPGEEITNLAEDLEIEYLLEDLPKMLASMQVGCKRIQGISTSLRIFSRADKDYKVPFNIHEGIDSTLLILKHRLKANDKRPAIEIVKHYGQLPEIDCFPGQLNQVFMNILANAIDALDEANTDLTFAEIKANPNCITIQTSLEEDRVQIRIADNGTGMREEVKQQIFDHLFTTKKVGKGTGLGMAIAQQIVVDRHGGRIAVQSELGQGTEFSIYLPIHVSSNSSS